MSESDVCRRQILTFKVDPPTVKVQGCIMAVDPYHSYLNDSERANQDIYNDFQIKHPLVSMVYTPIFQGPYSRTIIVKIRSYLKLS